MIFDPPDLSIFLEDAETKATLFSGQYAILDDDVGGLTEYCIFFVTVLDNFGVEGIPESFTAGPWMNETLFGRYEDQEDAGIDAVIQTAVYVLFFLDLDDAEDEAGRTVELVTRHSLTLPRVITLCEVLERQSEEAMPSIESVILMGQLIWDQRFNPTAKRSMVC